MKDLVFIPEEKKEMYKKNEIILHILEPEPDGHIGGADMHVYNLALAQLKRSSYLPMILINQNSQYAKRLEDAGIAYVRGHLLPGKKIRLLPYLKNLLCEYNIKLLHSHQYDANYITYLLRKKYKSWRKLPVVMTVHGWVETSLKNKIKTWLDFYTYKEAAAIISVSKNSLRRLWNYSGDKLLAYIPNGIYFESTESNITANTEIDVYGIPRNKKIVAIIGRLSPEKRIDIFLLACKELVKKRDDLHFMVVGSGEEYDALKKRVQQLEIENYVTFTGLVLNIEKIYKMIDILVISSDTEGTPRVALEAMYYQKPIVSTTVGGMPQIVNHGVTGYLVEKHDYCTIANYVNEILNDNNKYLEMGKEARKVFNDKFSIWKMQNEVENIYLKIIK